MSPFLTKTAGRLINLVGTVAPYRAGLLAFQLFSWIGSRQPANDKERELLAQSRVTMSEARLKLLKIAGGEVAIWHFPPVGVSTGQKILVVHGWGSRIDYLQTLITALRQTGAEVIGLDLPGHGRSRGRSLTLPLALEAIRAVSHRHGPFDVMLGHSFGGFATILSVAGAMGKDALPFPGRMVLIAAPASAKNVFDDFGRALGLSSRVQNALEDVIFRISGYEIGHFAGPAMLAELAVKTVVIHAEDDKEVPPESARRYASAGSHVNLVWANGHGHRRIVSAPDVMAIIVKSVSVDT